ncbi:hypothetical protein [Desmospora activa]|uniref:Uncharacterized protein n=1 Tax=Desmospora activa DSM 45169 TaxID=1121389 RepID=A0A2T4Z6J4_9BACL|nr:hypothetical protein [Desmospora activa]PTM57500.1 hypothetical protein C8J48_0048 [Desmospora activa DSM 45169]
MNIPAAVFACRFTGVIGILASCLFGYLYGLIGFVLGLIASMFWFSLAWYLQQGSHPKK